MRAWETQVTPACCCGRCIATCGSLQTIWAASPSHSMAHVAGRGIFSSATSPAHLDDGLPLRHVQAEVLDGGMVGRRLPGQQHHLHRAGRHTGCVTTGLTSSAAMKQRKVDQALAQPHTSWPPTPQGLSAATHRVLTLHRHKAQHKHVAAAAGVALQDGITQRAFPVELHLLRQQVEGRWGGRG